MHHSLDMSATRASHGSAAPPGAEWRPGANLNIHLHCLVLDGVYRHGTDGTPEFVEVPAPADEALQSVLRKISRRTIFGGAGNA